MLYLLYLPELKFVELRLNENYEFYQNRIKKIARNARISKNRNYRKIYPWVNIDLIWGWKGSTRTANSTKIAKITSIAILVKFVAERKILKIVVVLNPGHRIEYITQILRPGP